MFTSERPTKAFCFSLCTITHYTFSPKKVEGLSFTACVRWKMGARLCYLHDREVRNTNPERRL